MTASTRWLWIVAGVNGAGKTTLARQLLAELPFVNADEIAAQMAPEHPERAAMAAGRAVLRELEAMFELGKDVAWETTLSGNFHHRLIASAKRQSYEVGMLYIGLDSLLLP